jgi:hypothetical protein
MRRTITGALLLASVLIAGCGSSGGHFANRPRPPSPVNLTVYVNDHRVSLSPSAVGGGPVVFIVTNQASHAESLTVTQAGNPSATPLAQTSPISPQATTQVTVDMSPGAYVVAASDGGAAEAAASATSGIAPAQLHIGTERASSSGQLLSP